MSDVTEWIEERRGIHTAATAGPWESGYWYHVQGESHCMCGEDQGPLVGIDPHGGFGRMHVHRRPEPIWEEGIRTRDDSTGGSDVVVDTDEYGGTSTEDRAAIVDAHNTLPALLTAVEKVLELHTETTHGECAICFECTYDGAYEVDYSPFDYPCPTVQAVRSAIAASE